MMQQRQARDEAGNIWNIDEAGNPIGLAQPADAPSVVAPNPVQAQRQVTGLAGEQLGNQRTAQQIATEAATAPYAAPKAQLDVEAQRLANQKAERELAAPVEAEQGQKDRFSRLMQLAAQVGRTQYLYDTGIGTTKGIAGVQDYLPTDANARFDVAGASLSQQGLAAFRVPGTGTVSDRDAIMFDRANLPTAATRDAAVEEQLRSIRNRVDEELKAQGREPLDWSKITQQQGGGTPPGYAASSVEGGVSGGGGGSGTNFSSAAGVAMARRLSKAYNAGGGLTELNSILTENGYQPFTDPKMIEAIQKRGPLRFAPPVADDTRGAVGRALGGIADSAGGAYAINAADALTGNNLDSIAGGQSRLAIDYANERNPIASDIGTIAGSVIGAGGAELGLGAAAARAGFAGSPWIARGADALYGAVSGAGLADGEGESRLAGAALGGSLGVGGGIAGRAAARGIGGALKGVQNADVRGLRAAGVPLTVGQTLGQSGAVGSAIRGLENATSGIPLLGAQVRGRYADGFRGFNRAMFAEGTAPVGGGVTDIAEQGVEQAQNAVSGGFRRALDGRSIPSDPQGAVEMQAARQLGLSTPTYGDDFRTILDDEIQPIVGNSPDLNGQQFQDIDRTLSGYARQYGQIARGTAMTPPSPMARRVGTAFSNMQSALDGMVQRNVPDILPQYNAARQAHRNVEVLRDAVHRARNGTRAGGETGLVAPSQLIDAADANAAVYGNAAGTTRQPFYNLSRAGQNVLPNTIPTSGTSERATVTAGLAALGLGGASGGGAGYATGDAQSGAGLGLLAGAALAAGGSRAGQRALTGALLNRRDVAVRFGGWVGNRSRLGGIFGAPLLAANAPGAQALLLPPQ